MTAPSTRDQRELFETAPSWPDGFSYREDVLSGRDEAALSARFAALPFQPFEFHGYLGKRRIVSFGWRYDYAGRVLRESSAMTAPSASPLPMGTMTT